MPELKFNKEATILQREGMSDAPDRVVAIIFGVVIETRLSDSIKVTLREDKKLFDKLFGQNGSISAPGVKLQLAYMLGIIDETARRDLEQIIKIRNQFAHVIDVQSFDDPPVCDHIDCLSTKHSLIEFYEKLRKQSGRNGAQIVYNGISIRTDSRRVFFRWAVSHYMELLSLYEINKVGHRLQGDKYKPLEMSNPLTRVDRLPERSPDKS